MTDKDTLNNEKAWKILFEKYTILEHIEADGAFTISASAIKEFREPRLMTKFDHWVNLPTIFQENNLSCLELITICVFTGEKKDCLFWKYFDSIYRTKSMFSHGS